MDKTGSVVGMIDETLTGAVEKANDTTENIFEFAKVVGHVVKYLIGIINKD